MAKIIKTWLFSAIPGLLMGMAIFSMLMMPTVAEAQYGSGMCDQFTGVQEADASTSVLRWANQSQYSNNPVIQKNFNNLKDGIAYVDNNTGAVLLKENMQDFKNKKTANGLAFKEMSSAPVVVAYYDPITSVGRIWVDRSIRMGNGKILVEQLPFGPDEGAIMANWYSESGDIGTNPFWIYEQGKNGNASGLNHFAFVNINPAAFESAVGLVMRRFNAMEGWIAMLETTHVKSTSSSGNLFRKTTTTTVTYYAHPTWILALPSGSAPGGYTTGYKLPMCGPTGNPIIASTSAQATQDMGLWSTGLTQGLPTSLSYHGQTWGGIKVMSGVEFLNEGQGSVNLPTQQWQIYQHSQSQSGFTLITMAIFAIALGALTGGLAAGLLLSMAATTAATASAMMATVSFVGIGAGMAIGAATMAAVTLISDTGAFGLYGTPDFGPRGSSFRGVASGTGDTISASAPTIVSFDMNGYLNDLYSAGVGSGTSSQQYASNPTQPSGGWSGVVGAETNLVANGNNTANRYPSSLGQQANNATSASQGGTNAPGAPDSYTQQFTNGSVSSPYGALPPAP